MKFTKISAVLCMALVMTMLCFSGCTSLYTSLYEEQTFEEYYNEHLDEFEEIEAETAEMFKDSLDVKLCAKGNSLYYIYTFKADHSEYMTDEMWTQSLDSTLDSLAHTLGQNVVDLKNEVPSLESIIVEYRKPDGTLIASREYTEKDAQAQGDDRITSAMSEDGEMTVKQLGDMYAATYDDTYDTADMDIWVETRGNSIYYVYKLLNVDARIVTQTEIDNIKASFEQTEQDAFLVSSMKAVAPDLEKVVYEYVDCNGVLIYRHEIVAE